MRAIATSATGIAVVLSLMAIQGCALNDHFDEQVIRMDRSVETARNSLILTNIIRASFSFPLSFVTVPIVHGSSTVGGGIGLPTIAVGPSQTAAQQQYVFGPNSATATGTTSFDLAVLDSREFYSSLLTPLSLDTINFFTEQGYPRDLIFFLVLDRILVGKGAARQELRNDARSPTFERFDSMMRKALDRGLTTDVDKQTRKARLCFEPSLATVPVAKARPLCGSTDPSGATLLDTGIEARGTDIELVTRSTQGLFYYVGHLLNTPAPDQVVIPDRNGGTAGDLLFRVETTSVAEPCFAEADYGGRHYCVPFSARNAARVIGLFAELLALNKSINDLPLISTVRVTQ